MALGKKEYVEEEEKEDGEEKEENWKRRRGHWRSKEKKRRNRSNETHRERSEKVKHETWRKRKKERSVKKNLRRKKKRRRRWPCRGGWSIKRCSREGNSGPDPPGNSPGLPKCRLSGLHVNKATVIFFMLALQRPLSKTRNVCDSKMK